MSSKWIIYSNF